MSKHRKTFNEQLQRPAVLLSLQLAAADSSTLGFITTLFADACLLFACSQLSVHCGSGRCGCQRIWRQSDRALARILSRGLSEVSLDSESFIDQVFGAFDPSIAMASRAFCFMGNQEILSRRNSGVNVCHVFRFSPSASGAGI
jgi:hypothetical protein